MCSACGYPPAIGHWTDAGGQNPNERLRIRFRRIATINTAIKPIGLTARDLGSQPGIQLSDATGRTRHCPTLDDLWKEVSVLSGTDFDPLIAIDHMSANSSG